MTRSDELIWTMRRPGPPRAARAERDGPARGGAARLTGRLPAGGDTAGDVAWVCLVHAEKILITVPTAFIASQEPGIGAFMARRR
jgi:hypothetical protein